MKEYFANMSISRMLLGLFLGFAIGLVVWLVGMGLDYVLTAWETR